MGKTGGIYLGPSTFFSDTYSKGDFNGQEFWIQEQPNWGNIVHELEHKSKSSVLRGEGTTILECNSPIKLSVDGLLSTELPDTVNSDDEALVVLSNHISTFLSLLNLGGLFFKPTSEKQIVHITEEDRKIQQVSGGGDQYSVNDLDRAINRYQIPYHHGTPIINFNWVGLRIITSEKLAEHYKSGKAIINSLGVSSNQCVLFLEAYHNYTLHKWKNTLLLGWAFIEIILDKLWKDSILSNTQETEINRKKRLKDNRTYSASVKTEFLYTKGELDSDVYNQMNNLRSLRNALIHEGKHVGNEGVQDVFDVIKYLVKKVTNIEPIFHGPGWTRSGGWVE